MLLRIPEASGMHSGLNSNKKKFTTIFLYRSQPYILNFININIYAHSLECDKFKKYNIDLIKRNSKRIRKIVSCLLKYRKINRD